MTDTLDPRTPLAGRDSVGSLRSTCGRRTATDGDETS
jgi:hypothetical protein